jgi:hypothetical protein
MGIAGFRSLGPWLPPAPRRQKPCHPLLGAFSGRNVTDDFADGSEFSTSGNETLSKPRRQLDRRTPHLRWRRT